VPYTRDGRIRRTFFLITTALVSVGALKWTGLDLACVLTSPGAGSSQTAIGAASRAAAAASMAEVLIWSQDNIGKQGIRERMAAICDVLRQQCRGGRKMPTTSQSDKGIPDQDTGHETVDKALEELIAVFEGGGSDADKAATDFGRSGGHLFLLQLLEAEGDEGKVANTRDLAAEAVEHCMSLCSRFPMKSAILDAKSACDTMRCEIDIDSALNACGAALKLHLRRRSNGNEGDTGAAITISNMLWAGSLVLVRHLQSNPHLIPSVRCIHDGQDTPPQILEIGAGLGAGGLGVAVLARHLNRAVSVRITDFDVSAVDMICSSVRCNMLVPTSDAAHVSAEGHVLDWDRLDDFRDRCGHSTYDLVIGAEVVHEKSHAAGVLGAVRQLMSKHGRAILVNGAPKHRFGVAEFQEMLDNDDDLVYELTPVRSELTVGMESLQDDMLALQLYTISWRLHPPPPSKEHEEELQVFGPRETCKMIATSN
jgi:hypothetical protein